MHMLSLPKFRFKLILRRMSSHTRVSVGEAYRAIARVQRRLPGVETTEVQVHMATYSLFATGSSTAGCPQAVQISITMVVEVASGNGHE